MVKMDEPVHNFLIFSFEVKMEIIKVTKYATNVFLTRTLQMFCHPQRIRRV